MKTLISGHRLFKLENYNIEWIIEAINYALTDTFLNQTQIGFSGMASGVDLWFCQACINNNIRYIACPPFIEQDQTMDEDSRELRQKMLDNAVQILSIRNSMMVEKVDAGLIIFDGNKGGTHNVFQQMVEKNKPFVWINPVGQHVWELG